MDKKKRRVRGDSSAHALVQAGTREESDLRKALRLPFARGALDLFYFLFFYPLRPRNSVATGANPRLRLIGALHSAFLLPSLFLIARHSLHCPGQ